MFRTLPLMHELERRSRALGWTWERLARELGMDRTTLAHVRSGRDRLSLANLHKIALWFPNDDTLRRLTWEYLLLDIATAKERRSAATATQMADLSPSTVERLTRFVHEFPSHVISGSGLLLESDDAALLASALAFLESEFAARAIRVVRERAASRIAPSAASNFAAVPLLLIDRIEFASPSVAALLRERGAVAKVNVVTRHTNTPAQDERLLTEIAPRMARIVIAAVPSRSPHA